MTTIARRLPGCRRQIVFTEHYESHAASARRSGVCSTAGRHSSISTGR